LLLEVSLETILVVLSRILQRSWVASLSLKLRCERLWMDSNSLGLWGFVK
ncbi:hypothetical protein LINGRAHAP2_LOCUS8121, partial [Linum grandiflorum]